MLSRLLAQRPGMLCQNTPFTASSKRGFSGSLFQTSSSDTDYILTFSLGLSVPTLRRFCRLTSMIWNDMKHYNVQGRWCLHRSTVNLSLPALRCSTDWTDSPKFSQSCFTSSKTHQRSHLTMHQTIGLTDYYWTQLWDNRANELLSDPTIGLPG